MQTLLQFKDTVSDSMMDLTIQRLKQEIEPMKQGNVVTEQYRLHQTQADDIADRLIKEKGVNAFYVYGSEDSLMFDYGTLDLDGFNIFYLRYMNRETREYSEPIAEHFSLQDGDDAQFFAMMAVLYAIAKKIHYKELTRKIEALSGLELLAMSLLYMQGENS